MPQKKSRVIKYAELRKKIESTSYEDDEEDSDEDEEASNECEVIPFKSKEDSDEK